MITAITGETLARAKLLLRRGGWIGMRIASALRCYGVAHAACRFYLAGENAVLMTLGGGALLCGSMADVEELESFLSFAGVTRFLSDRTMLYTWRIVPQLLMRYEAAPAKTPPPYAVEEKPNLWQLAHSGLLSGADAEGWYADACLRVNRGEADVRAIADGGAYIATAGVYALDADKAYITAVATGAAHRKKGCAAALLASLCAQYAPAHTLYLLCAPGLRRFYEKQGFALCAPICEFERTNDPA